MTRPPSNGRRDQGRVNLVVLGARIYDAQAASWSARPRPPSIWRRRPSCSGQFVIKRITLVGVAIHPGAHEERRHPAGQSRRTPATTSLIGRISDVINAHGGQSSSLESFAVRDARLGFYDEITGLNLTAPRANMVMRAHGQAPSAPASMPMSIISGSNEPCHRRSDAAAGQGAGHRQLWRSPDWICGRWAPMRNFFAGVKDIPDRGQRLDQFPAWTGGQFARLRRLRHHRPWRDSLARMKSKALQMSKSAAGRPL